MAKKLYVGNLSYQTREETLQALFSGVGSVESVRVITDRQTGRSKGFGFVEMSSDEEAQNAIEKFNQQEFEGRKITVSVAQDKDPASAGKRKGSFQGNGGGNNYRDRD